jgi:hypothetical protein
MYPDKYPKSDWVQPEQKPQEKPEKDTDHLDPDEDHYDWVQSFGDLL